MKLIRITTIPGSLKGLLRGQLRFMSENGYEVIGVSSSGEALKEVEINEGVAVVSIEMTRTISPLKDLQALYKLIKFFKKEKPQIVHTHTPKAGLLGMMAAKITRVPNRLHTVAGMPLTVATGNKRRLLDQMERLTYFCATKIYPNSYGLEKIIIDNKYTSKNKLKVIAKGSSNGIDTTQFDPSSVSETSKKRIRKELGINDNDFIFLFVGRIVKDKGINELIKAFSELSSEYPHIHLVLAGRYEMNLNPITLETKSTIELNSRIHPVGFQSEIKDYFAFADVLTFPSYREGFPNVVMQAAAMQLNSIVSNINGCNEIVKNGENGWIVPVENSDELKNRMEWCINNQAQSKEMGLKSRQIMVADYERNFVWHEILKEYRSLNN